MLVEISSKNGVGVHVYGQNNVVESFLIGDLFFVVFENGKSIISLAGGECLLVNDLGFKIVDLS
jgi:hypothetical protein